MKMEELAAGVYAILCDVYASSPWSLEQVLADLEQENTDYFYAYQDKEIVGFLAIQNVVGELEVTNLAVKTAYQGRGLAKQLLSQLLERQEPIFLEVRASNHAAQQLYREFGFVEIARRKAYYHQPVEDALVMQRLPKE